MEDKPGFPIKNVGNDGTQYSHSGFPITNVGNDRKTPLLLFVVIPAVVSGDPSDS